MPKAPFQTVQLTIPKITEHVNFGTFCTDQCETYASFRTVIFEEKVVTQVLMLVTLVFDESEGDDGECDADPPVPYTSCSLSHTQKETATLLSLVLTKLMVCKYEQKQSGSTQVWLIVVQSIRRRRQRGKLNQRKLSFCWPSVPTQRAERRREDQENK